MDNAHLTITGPVYPIKEIEGIIKDEEGISITAQNSEGESRTLCIECVDATEVMSAVFVATAHFREDTVHVHYFRNIDGSTAHIVHSEITGDRAVDIRREFVDIDD